MNLSLTLAASVTIGVYLAAVVWVGYATRQRGGAASLGEFYLAGRNLGGFVLLLTLLATQNSGNLFLTFPGEAFSRGYAWVVSVGFAVAIIVVYLIFAPRLQAVARRHAFVTPGDWIAHRFGSPSLTLLANVLMVVAISNYLLAQLMAMGHVTEGLSGGAVPYWVGVVLLTLVVIVYETVGGMRAVAWTDCVQGIMLLVGLGGLLLAAVPTPGHLAELTTAVAAVAPEKVAVPEWDVARNWFSMILLTGFSAAVYPHAIQRIYAARDAATLKRAFSMMVFLSPLTSGVVFLVGILAISELPAGGDAAQVMPALLTAWSARSALLFGLCVMVITAVVAAVMSTADSVLLTLSSILAKDIVGKTLLRGASEDRLTRVGKRLSWAVVAVLVMIALSPRVTLWGLFEIKLEILAQVSPLFVLGVTWRRLTTSAALSGVLAGCATYAGLLVMGRPDVWDIQAGLVGLGVNMAVCVGVTLFRPRPVEHAGRLAAVPRPPAADEVLPPVRGAHG